MGSNLFYHAKTIAELDRLTDDELVKLSSRHSSFYLMSNAMAVEQDHLLNYYAGRNVQPQFRELTLEQRVQIFSKQVFNVKWVPRFEIDKVFDDETV